MKNPIKDCVINMLISVSHRFVFVANTKAASTAIEHVLKDYSEIAIRHQAYGKHWPCKRIERFFSAYVRQFDMPFEALLRFGVVRDPVDWALSWYNYRRRKALSLDSEKSCHGVPINNFINELSKRGGQKPFAKVGTQAQRFTDRMGELMVDWLVPYPSLGKALPALGASLGIAECVDIRKEVINSSPTHVKRHDLTEDQQQTIRRVLAKDDALFQRASVNFESELASCLRQKRSAFPAVWE